MDSLMQDALKRSLTDADILELTRSFTADGKRMLFQGQLRGRSMWPFIRTGDRILVEQTDPAQLQVNDVLVFQSPAGRTTAHRLIRLDNSRTSPRFITRGDFSLRPDAPFGPERLIGRIVAIERKGKKKDITAPLHRLAVHLWRTFHPIPQIAIRGLVRIARCGRSSW